MICIDFTLIIFLFCNLYINKVMKMWNTTIGSLDIVMLIYFEDYITPL